MEGKRLIERLTMRNFLSYGSEGASIDLLPLNVLIGPNASGKSNLIEALAVLRAAENDLAQWIRQGGGVDEYIWKGAAAAPSMLAASVAIPESLALFPDPLLYELSFRAENHRLVVQGEGIAQESASSGGKQLFYELRDGHARIWQHGMGEEFPHFPDLVEREIRTRDLAADQSILSQRKDPELYPELTYLSNEFGRIVVFQDWSFGRRTQIRFSQPTDLPSGFLLPDGSNFVLVLHALLQRSETEDRLTEHLRRFYQSARRIRVEVYGGRMELLIEEESGQRVPAARLSDGTLRYLSLLTILLHPSPPPLVCIEEPELGLHPDILPIIAELLLDASKRTQLVVTTHSDALVSALSEVPESIVVCESGVEGTQLRRLERDALTAWLERYSLGEMWRMGELGGTRW